MKITHFTKNEIESVEELADQHKALAEMLIDSGETGAEVGRNHTQDMEVLHEVRRALIAGNAVIAGFALVELPKPIRFGVPLELREKIANAIQDVQGERR